ncbi:MAG: iron-containing alcohol dehydrogenase [Clostridiales bacterium]|jgi:glycerol-1-phosphate dehydrogenase [NAD(P)+]|nr:iron-containing alcohol dehydrogenase [Clostridiales bacterium]
MDLKGLLADFKDCACGRPHESGIAGIYIERGVTARTGELLKRHGFFGRLLVVADKNTLAAAKGLMEALSGFIVVSVVYPDKREPYYEDVLDIARKAGEADGVLSVGTGTLNDICRLACKLAAAPFAVYATAPSMDGFASASAPIVKNGFKRSYDAVQPRVILADTAVLAAAPAHLKAAGFGDMMGKYIGLADWQAARLLADEYHCERVARLSLAATDRILSMADKVRSKDEGTAAAIMECLILTGLGMGFTKNSRPASGTEHIVSHYLDITQLKAGIRPDYHGFQVGVAALTIARRYHGYIGFGRAALVPDRTDWPAVYAAYGPDMRAEIEADNTPPLTDALDPDRVAAVWPELCAAVRALLPAPERLEAALLAAGCPTDAAGIGVSDGLYGEALLYHPYMRRRLTLERVMPVLKLS